ncbi:ribonuclease D [Chamaesiphon sp. GL140_3_metabinner_50]|uniref:ribonuclease D n=1 Tax=Chamaesiphon sp. GL140_3_metabinner_50 TaxID=2970812 RepID=UPI0025DA7CB0|nr:ribonuclease D [Chamaesiphon sp. GL140_3_metabinner_50]
MSYDVDRAISPALNMEDFQICDRDLDDALTAKYLQAESIAVDTETMGLNYHRDRLCLVQLFSPGALTVIRIAKGQTTAPNLQQVMQSTTVTKVFHFARFDVAQLSYRLGIETQPIFCTKIASKLIRTYSNRHGLKELVSQLEGVDLDKSAQCSDWGDAENLSEHQLRYAANDVRYLISMRQKLTAKLQREDRWELAQDCFKVLPTLVALDILQYEDIFSHH